jgi:nucleoside-diphosphate-sugar epimerase
MQVLVTGATGFLGSHISERLVARGDSVRCLVRPTSRTRYLETLGVELIEGDVTNATSLPAALEGVDVVYHAAALVTDWAPWSEFRSVTINGTRNMLKAAATANVGRFLHVSSDAVYRYADLAKGVHEESPYEARFGWLDYYRRSKTAAEKIVRRHHRNGRLAVSIVRPALILGERDGAMLPSIMQFLNGSSAAFIGRGYNRQPCVYAGDVADLCIRAATGEDAAGEIYNAVSDEYVTQADLYQAVVDVTELQMPKRSAPMRAFYVRAAGMEGRARLRGWDHRPELTRFWVNLLGLSYHEDPWKAMRQLGWSPEVTMREAVKRSVEWSRSRRREPASG